MIYLLRYWKQIAMVLACAYFLIAAYGRGYNKANDEWVIKWSNYQQEIVEFKLAHEQQVRQLQTELQSTADRVQENGNDKRNNLEVDIADGRDALGSVRDTAAEFAASAKDCPSNTNAADNSKTATGPAVVLAKLLSSAEQRATELAAAYDKAKLAGDACEQAYDNLRWQLMFESK